jgi:hypothetical protein
VRLRRRLHLAGILRCDWSARRLRALAAGAPLEGGVAPLACGSFD